MSTFEAKAKVESNRTKRELFAFSVHRHLASNIVEKKESRVWFQVRAC